MVDLLPTHRFKLHDPLLQPYWTNAPPEDY